MSIIFRNERRSPLPENESIWRDLSGLVHVVKAVHGGFSRAIETRAVHGREHRFSADEFEEFESVII